jgi:hypothetical protein
MCRASGRHRRTMSGSSLYTPEPARVFATPHDPGWRGADVKAAPHNLTADCRFRDSSESDNLARVPYDDTYPTLFLLPERR